VTSLVVALRWAAREVRPAPELAALVRAAIDRAAVGGARLLGVAADGASFGFDEDALEEAIDLALALVAEGDAALFKVGIGRGDLAPIADEGPLRHLSVGNGMARAAAMARVGRPGEVVVDLSVPQAATGALLSIGRRVASDGTRRFRGIVLDVVEPFRRGGGESISRIRAPRVVGRESAFEALGNVGPGGLALVRGSPGSGGSRFLDEVAARTARAVIIAPSGCGAEPLGALRLALSGDPPSLGAGGTELLRALMAGAGISVDGASDLLFEWLSSSAPGNERPLILVDDAGQIDTATLEAVGFAAGAAGAPFAVVARLDAGEPIPTPLASLVVEAELSLRPLLPHEATAALEDACGGSASASPEVVRRWVRRGGGVPLAIVESLRHGLAVGELAIRDDVVVPRAKTSGRGRTLSPHAWVTRRLAALAADRPADAMLVTLVAVAGAGLARAFVDDAAEDLGLPKGEALTQAINRLAGERLIVLHGNRLSPSSRTLRDAAIMRCDEVQLRRLHGALYGAIARGGQGLELAEGAQHAALSGDHMGAAALAVRAADRAKRAGLGTWADHLHAFAKAEGVDAPTPTTPSPPPVAVEEAEELDESVLESIFPESEPVSTMRTPPPPMAPVATMAQPTITVLDHPALGRATLGVGNLTTVQIAALPSPIVPPSTVAQAQLSADDTAEVHVDMGEPASSTSEEEALRLTADSARRALLSRDFPALDTALSRLEAEGGSVPAIARVRGVAALARGNVAEGVRLIRRSRHGARTASEAARGALASAVAYGVAGRRDEALLEALEALASERLRGNGTPTAGDLAVRRLIERLLH
jgi:hypothetical protein